MRNSSALLLVILWIANCASNSRLTTCVRNVMPMRAAFPGIATEASTAPACGANFAREKPVCLFSPAGSHAILQHRLQGFLWDLVDGTPGRLFVTEIRRDGLFTVDFRSAEGFAFSFGSLASLATVLPLSSRSRLN